MRGQVREHSSGGYGAMMGTYAPQPQQIQHQVPICPPSTGPQYPQPPICPLSTGPHYLQPSPNLAYMSPAPQHMHLHGTYPDGQFAGPLSVQYPQYVAPYAVGANTMHHPQSFQHQHPPSRPTSATGFIGQNTNATQGAYGIQVRLL